DQVFARFRDPLPVSLDQGNLAQRADAVDSPAAIPRLATEIGASQPVDQFGLWNRCFIEREAARPVKAMAVASAIQHALQRSNQRAFRKRVKRLSGYLNRRHIRENIRLGACEAKGVRRQNLERSENRGQLMMDRDGHKRLPVSRTDELVGESVR